MSWLSGILGGLGSAGKQILPLASAAAPFIPGFGTVGKIGLMAANSLLAGNDAARAQRNALSNAQSGYNSLDASGQQMGQLGYNNLLPILGQYQQTINNGGIPNFDNRFRSYVEGRAPGYDNAVANTMRDFGDRGIGMNSSVVGNAVSSIRNAQQADATRMSGEIINNGINQRNSMLMNGIPLMSGLMSQGNNLRMGAMSGLGGVGALYGSQANGWQNSLNSLGELVPLLTMGSNKDPNAGDNTTGTNQAGRQMNIDRQLIPKTGVDYANRLLSGGRLN